MGSRKPLETQREPVPIRAIFGALGGDVTSGL